MLKKRTRIIICLLLILFMISIFIPFLVLKCFSQNNSFGYRHPDYKYTYPEEYHLENLRAKTSEIFKEEIDEYHIVVSILNFGFSYFSNIHTLSIVLNKDMNTASEITNRADFVSNMILNSLLK